MSEEENNTIWNGMKGLRGFAIFLSVLGLILKVPILCDLGASGFLFMEIPTRGEERVLIKPSASRGIVILLNFHF